jgi:hypothetical protein
MNYAIFNCKLNEKKFCIYAKNILLDIMDIVMHPKIHQFSYGWMTMFSHSGHTIKVDENC